MTVNETETLSDLEAALGEALLQPRTPACPPPSPPSPVPDLVEEARATVRAMADVQLALEHSLERQAALQLEQAEAEKALQWSLREASSTRDLVRAETANLSDQVLRLEAVTANLRNQMMLFHRGIYLRVYVTTLTVMGAALLLTGMLVRC